MALVLGLQGKQVSRTHAVTGGCSMLLALAFFGFVALMLWAAATTGSWQ